MYVYCVYPAMSQSPKQLPIYIANCLKRAEIIDVLIFFNGICCFSTNQALRR